MCLVMTPSLLQDFVLSSSGSLIKNYIFFSPVVGYIWSEVASVMAKMVPTQLKELAQRSNVAVVAKDAFCQRLLLFLFVT